VGAVGARRFPARMLRWFSSAGPPLWLGLTAVAWLPEAGAADQGVLRIEMEVAGAKVSLVADAFREESGPSARPGERRFVADRVRTVFSGAQTATYRLGGGEKAEDWISRHEMTVRLDESAEYRRGESATENSGPHAVVVTVGPAPEAGGTDLPLIGIEVECPAPGTGSGSWQVERAGGGVRTETTWVRTLKEGRPAESAPSVEEARFVPRCRVRIGSGTESGQLLRHGLTRAPEFAFEDEELRVVKVASGTRVAAGGELEGLSRGVGLPGVEGGFGDVPVRLRWSFRWGGAPDVGWFELADSEAVPGGEWPARGARRDAVIRLGRPEIVEAIRVTLHDVSAWPGVALNAGEALLAKPTGWADLREAVPVTFADGEFVLGWERRPVAVRPLPEDRAPDLYFAPGDHPGFRVEDGNGGERAGSLLTEEVEPEVLVRVRAADWGASGSLGVEVRMDGVWEELEPRGPGADREALRLRFPGAGPEGAAGEDDADGDGLTAAQEYRGVVAGGAHRRLNPEVREVFVADPDGCLGEEERIALGRMFAPWRIELVFLDEGEHLRETVGNAVRVLVLEPFGARFGSRLRALEDVPAQRAALRATRPRPGVGTLFVEGPVDAAGLAGDMARALGLDEWGAQP